MIPETRCAGAQPQKVGPTAPRSGLGSLLKSGRNFHRRLTKRHELAVVPLDKVRLFPLARVEPLVEPLRDDDTTLVLPRTAPRGRTLKDGFARRVDGAQSGRGRIRVPAAGFPYQFWLSAVLTRSAFVRAWRGRNARSHPAATRKKTHCGTRPHLSRSSS